METSDAIDALYDELHERSAVVVELDAAQIEGWTSGLFAAWESDDEALGFVTYCVDRPGPTSAILLHALAIIGDDDMKHAAEIAAGTMSGQAPEVVGNLGRSVPAHAWSVSAPFGRSLVVGFASTDELVDHAVLAELDENGALVDLQLAGEPEELLASDSVSAAIEVAEGDVVAVLSEISAAWRLAVDQGVEPTPGIAANQHLVRHRLESALDTELALMSVDEASIDRTRGMTPEEIAQANAAALSTLTAAVGETTGEVHAAWVDVVTAHVPGLTPRERDGLLWLEWADWLGAGIGMLRAGAGTPVNGSALVDLINRCPEISSTVHANDRDYAEWAFEVAVDHLTDSELVVDGLLTDTGVRSLQASLTLAWT